MHTQSPFFSIIIPTYNRAQLLPVAIKSVINQVYTNWELLIIDDGSTDSTESVVAQFKDKRIRHIYQTHQERSIARNRGIHEAKGSYICFMDDDDFYLNNHLSIFFQELQKNNFPQTILRTGFIRKKEKKSIKSAQYDLLRDQNPVRFAAFHFCSVCTLCIPKSCLVPNLFPPEFRHWQDTHLILRLLAQFSFQQLPVFTYMYIFHPVMGSKTIYTLPDNEDRIESNVSAIVHLFDNYGDIINPYLPLYTKDYLVCEKYLGHANGAIENRQLTLTTKLIKKSIQYNRKFWFAKRYLKLGIKLLFCRF